MSTDKIEKHVDLKAPMSRVWRALTDAEQFGAWFGVKFDGPFVPGKVAKGRFTIPNFTHLVGDFHIERIDQPAGVFTFRWHPFAIEPNVDYSAEPLTTVAFTLTETTAGSHLQITEAGFDALPAERRAKAFASNTEGWSIQSKHITEYLA
jgi:uncharacterized protein YndB with AHSA1/START domain